LEERIMKLSMFAGIAAATLLTGCATTITSVPLSKRACEDAASSGIPYYLPRPYLLVTKNFAVSESTKTSNITEQTELDKKTKNTSQTTTVSASPPSTSGDLLAWQIVYLPDLEQKYGLRFKRGWGKHDTAIQLSDGWMLAGINMKADADTANTIGAIGTAIKDIMAVALPVPTKGGEAPISADKGLELAPAPSVGFWLYDIGGPGKPRLAFQWPDEAGSGGR
jgi:hypothetical protein